MARLNKLLLVALVCLLGEAVYGQSALTRPRKLGLGVIKTIRDVSIDDATLDSPREFSELISVVHPQEWKPNFDPTTDTLLEKAGRVSFQREIWSLEFGFKTLRVINVGGRDIWYFVYFVRNIGDTRVPSTTASKSIEIKGTKRELRFVPTFLLQAHDVKKAYCDQIRPEVVSKIAAKERVTHGRLHDSASISRIKIPVSSETVDRRVWGVATWEGVDPRADFISVFVEGLTNAYRWEPPKGGYKPTHDHLEQDLVRSKALQVNFWRGGDAIDLDDNEIWYGIPLYPDDLARQQKVLQIYKLNNPTEYQWVYR